MAIHVYTPDYRILEILKHHGHIDLVVCEEAKMSSILIDYCSWNKIRLEIATPELFIQLIKEERDNSDLAFSFGFGHIFSGQEIGIYKNGLWNIHPGELPKYRGRHPITHAILNGDKFLTVTIHQINEEIDQGNLIASDKIYRDFSDTENSLIEKTLGLLDRSLIKQAKINFENGNISPIAFAPFQRNFNNGINLDQSKDYTCDYVYNAVKSQFDHGGLKVDGENYRRAHYSLFGRTAENPDLIFDCVDGKIFLFKN